MSQQTNVDLITILIHYLNINNNILRIDAVHALRQHAPADCTHTRHALLNILLDNDPDLRTDAMEALQKFSQPKDAEIICQSLINDPVREVKIAAINVLTQLKSPTSIPLFKMLAIARNDDKIAWEDENEAWDDWLEVQIAAIKALGHMKAEKTIEILLTAYKDEYGQNLDIEVFNALANIDSSGITTLLKIIQTTKGLSHKRALEALSQSTNTTVLKKHRKYLLNNSMADIRRLAIKLFDANHPAAYKLALHDPDTDLRCEALRHYAPICRELVTLSLFDKNETIQATALDLLELPLDTKTTAMLSTNAEAWLFVANAKLATATARILPQISPDKASDLLQLLIKKNSRPLKARLAAVDSLASLKDKTTIKHIIDLLSNETQQIRMLALTHLAKFSHANNEESTQALIMAVNGTLLPKDKAVIIRNDEKKAIDFATPKVEDLKPRLIISSDGEIISGTKDKNTPSSTLQNIQTIALPPHKKESTKKNNIHTRKRRAVEGPDTIAYDLTRVALTIVANIPDKRIETAIIMATQSNDNQQRLQAYNALLIRAKILPIQTDILNQILSGLSDSLPAIRSLAAQIAALIPKLFPILTNYLSDKDPIVRATAVKYLKNITKILTFLGDSDSIVRQAALQKVLTVNTQPIIDKTFDILLKNECIDTLTKGVQKSNAIKKRAFDKLTQENITIKQAHILLQTLSNPIM